MPASSTPSPLLSVRDLRTYYHTDAGFVRAVDGVSFDVPRGGSVGIAGESGCGKTQTALSILGLIDDAPGIVGGQVWVDGENLLDGLGACCSIQENNGALTVAKDVGRWRKLHHRRLTRVRGRKISIVFQEPRSSLIPYRTVGEHLRETMAALDGKEATRAFEERAPALLEKLRFAHPDRVLHSYPHELSGGESQRVMLGLALMGRPQLLIADEPTTLLDAVTQRGVLEMLAAVVHEMNLALMLITHNLALLRLLVDRVVVMFAGQVVEQGPVAEVIDAAAGERSHPYTQDLLRVVADLDHPFTLPRASTPTTINPKVNRQGCRYFYRCRLKDRLSEDGKSRCLHEAPPAIPLEANHTVACWAYEDTGHGSRVMGHGS